MRTPKVLIVPASGLLWVLKLEGLDRGALGNKNRSIGSDCLVRVGLIVCTDGSCSGDQVGVGEAGRGNAN